MRFYLDTGSPQEVREAATFPFVAGFSTNPLLLRKAGMLRPEPLLEAALESGRRDFKAWIQTDGENRAEILEKVRQLEAHFFALTGGEWAGPTLVHKIMPTFEGLWAAAHLARAGKEVCITGIANRVQAILVATLPAVPPDEASGGCEGPPASRTPPRPHAVAFYVGRVVDKGKDGVGEVAACCAALVSAGLRVRVLAASIRSYDVVRALIEAVTNAGAASALDLTLPLGLLKTLLDDPVTERALAEFRAL